MKQLPIHDATAPISCSIEADEIPARLELFARIQANLTRVERTEHGLLLHFPADEDVERDLRQFAVDEKRCCQFWGFAVDAVDDEVTLRWDGPPAAHELVDRLVAYFEGDEPVVNIAELL